LGYVVGLRHYRREPEHVRELCSELVALGGRMGLDPCKVVGAALGAWVERDVEAALRCLSVLSGFGGDATMPYWGSMVAESEAAAGKFGDAVERLRQALSLAMELRELYYVPELYRFLGTYLLAQGDHAVGEAEHCFREAIDVARGQGARMPELRATLQLCRILRTQGRTEEAKTMLERVYAWFTEGFETPELEEARALLSELQGPRRCA